MGGGGDVQILNLHIFPPVSHKFSIGENAIKSKYSKSPLWCIQNKYNKVLIKERKC